jgi:hypothetical protein
MEQWIDFVMPLSSGFLSKAAEALSKTPSKGVTFASYNERPLEGAQYVSLR